VRSEDRDAAYSDFVQARRTHLRRIAYALCGDWHRADDLVQTALVKLYVAWPRLQRDGNAEAYVRTIIVRSNIDDSRRPWRREHVGLEGRDTAAQEPLPVEDRSELFEALQRLPLMQRKTVLLRHWLGLSVTETASELRISRSWATRRLSRPRRRRDRAWPARSGGSRTGTAGSRPPRRPARRGRSAAGASRR
jgi:RNA polymerase sigma factor (sigma-70 family)